MVLSISLLGPLTVTIDGAAVAVGGGKQRTVLAVLAADAGRVVSTERLIEAVWGDDASPGAGNTLQVYVSSLRKVLAPARAGAGHDIIATRRPGYALEVERDEVDLLGFEADCVAARRALQGGRTDDALPLFESALGRWRGDALADLADQPWAVAVATRLDAMRMSAASDRIDLLLAAGRTADALPELQARHADHPLDERIAGQLMLALYRSGRQAQALAVHRAVRNALVDQLGLEPGPALRELESRILRQDPALEQRAAPSGAALDEQATLLRSSVKLPTAWLVRGGEQWHLDRPVTTVGRRADRDIVVADPDASRAHAEIRRQPDGYVLVDTSTNGTALNGRRVRREEVLDDGDRITLGATTFTFTLRPPGS